MREGTYSSQKCIWMGVRSFFQSIMSEKPLMRSVYGGCKNSLL